MTSYFLGKVLDIPMEHQINAVLEEMERVGVASEEYPKLMTYLERLNDVKMKQHQNRMSRDTIAVVVGNLLGILIIVAYEQRHVITSRGFTQIIRPR